METKFLISLIFLVQAIMDSTNLAIAQSITQSYKCSKNGNFTDKLLEQRDHGFDLLYKNMDRSYEGYGTASTDGVYTKSACPTNTKMQECRDCVNKTIPFLKKSCPKEKEGVAWTILPKMYCMLRYADTAEPNLNDWFYFYSPASQPPAPGNAGELEKGVNDLANKLKDQASGTKTYAAGSITYGAGSHTLYGSMQCPVDFNKSPGDCKKCLSDATNEITKCCGKLRKQSGKVFSAVCQFWYTHINFLPKTLPTNLRGFQDP